MDREKLGYSKINGEGKSHASSVSAMVEEIVEEWEVNPPSPFVSAANRKATSEKAAAPDPPATLDEDDLIKQRVRRNPRGRRTPGAISEESLVASPTRTGVNNRVEFSSPSRNPLISGDVPFTRSPRSARLAGMSDEDRRLKYEARMALVEQHHGGRQQRRTSSDGYGTTTSPVSSSKRSSRRNNSEEDNNDYSAILHEMEQQRLRDRQAKIDGFAPPSRNHAGARSAFDMTAKSTVTEDSGNDPTFQSAYGLRLKSLSIEKSEHDGIKKRIDSKIPNLDRRYSRVQTTPENDNPENLAVAIAIEDDDDDEDKVIAYAVEYDPDSRPPLYKNRRFRVYAIGVIVGFAVLISLMAVIIVISRNNQNDTPTEKETEVPSAAPTSSLEGIYMRHFADMLKSDKVFEPGTPHYSAAQWIIHDDPMRLSPSATNLLQRFMMAFLWFHTTKNGEAEWRSCNPPREGENHTCVYEDISFDDNDEIVFELVENKYRWLSDKDECSWVGVICEGSPTVLGLVLFGHNMTGTLPTELAVLPFLQRISFAHNQLTGTIPPIYGAMKYLIDLELHYNLLDSTIPKEFFGGRSLLQRLNIGGNTMSGTLDRGIGTLQDLKGLHLFENSFTGEFPTEIGKLDLLAYIRMEENEFSGPIPSELGALSQLVEFWAQQNNFTSTIASELGQLSRLEQLRFSFNKLTGTIPEELFNLTNVEVLFLDNNKLTGTLSPAVGQLKETGYFRVNDNALSGSIPSELQYVSRLVQIWLHYNQFIGEIPIGICSLFLPSDPGTGLISLQADCSGDPIPNECLCCTACCDRGDYFCFKV